MKTALCLLTLNEKECLEKILPSIPQPSEENGFDEIYAIDGGSTDGTLDFLKEKNIPVVGQSKRGRGEAFHEAFRNINADLFIFFSPDGNEDPKDIPKFKKFFNDGADLVIASRMMKASYNEEDDLIFKWRKWANNSFNILANLFFRRKGSFVTDSINGFRGLTRETYNKLQLSAQDYTIEYQMTIRAFKKKLQIQEFATHEGERIAGETGAPSIPTGLRFIKRFITEIFGLN